jgi:hypothetical protein
MMNNFSVHSAELADEAEEHENLIGFHESRPVLRRAVAGAHGGAAGGCGRERLRCARRRACADRRHQMASRWGVAVLLQMSARD